MPFFLSGNGANPFGSLSPFRLQVLNIVRSGWLFPVCPHGALREPLFESEERFFNQLERDACDQPGSQEACNRDGWLRKAAQGMAEGRDHKLLVEVGGIRDSTEIDDCPRIHPACAGCLDELKHQNHEQNRIESESYNVAVGDAKRGTAEDGKQQRGKGEGKITWPAKLRHQPGGAAKVKKDGKEAADEDGIDPGFERGVDIGIAHPSEVKKAPIDPQCGNEEEQTARQRRKPIAKEDEGGGPQEIKLFFDGKRPGMAEEAAGIVMCALVVVVDVKQGGDGLGPDDLRMPER